MARIDFEVKNYRCFEDKKPLRFSIQRGAIAFTGPNNAGKSTILKFLYEFRHLWSNLLNIRSKMQSGSDEFLSIQEQPFRVSLVNVRDPVEVFCNNNERPLQIEMHFDGIPERSHIRKFHITINRNLQTIIAAYDNYHSQIGGKEVETKQILQHLNSMNIETTHNDLLTALINCQYIGAFRNAINIGEGEYFDLKTGTSFIAAWNDWKNGYTKEYSKAIHKVTTDIKNLFNLDSLEIAPASDAKTLMVTVNGKGYRLDELGAGLSQFIIVLGNLAIKKPHLVLIDEPELNLHPAMQVQFLSIVESYAKFGVLFSTHSLGLARSGANYAYSIIKKENFSSINLLGSDNSFLELAGELSYSFYPEMGAGKILLCEGTSEIKLLQHFLRLLKKDKDVLIMQLGGSSLINGQTAQEMNELLRLKVPIHILIDSEKQSRDVSLPKDRQAFIENCKKLGYNIHVLERRAIENYLTGESINKVKGEKYRALAEFEALQNVNPHWAKNENWKIAIEMTLKDIANTDLGKFLETI